MMESRAEYLMLEPTWYDESRFWHLAKIWTITKQFQFLAEEDGSE